MYIIIAHTSPLEDICIGQFTFICAIMWMVSVSTQKLLCEDGSNDWLVHHHLYNVWYGAEAWRYSVNIMDWIYGWIIWVKMEVRRRMLVTSCPFPVPISHSSPHILNTTTAFSDYNFISHLGTETRSFLNGQEIDGVDCISIRLTWFHWACLAPRHIYLVSLVHYPVL